ncbi:patatin-like phospholipase family protein [Hazenella sp. IB182353]|uniref:patatin-like phospholipase family protein n=1 Tax=Polycladospora coralii TaxID=2771432 RepID=UPI001747C5C9|nr:patatin-like phospholipase family protein [Polycladospora coralii]MBS7530872.1 patatin-like phospholipase family protein [Polycladospora coralii]
MGCIYSIKENRDPMKGVVKIWADAVFEGGGIKGIGLVGALCVAESKGYRWKKIAGTSAGSMIAALLAAGFKADELYELLIKQNFMDFVTPHWYDKIPYLVPSTRLWFKKGMHSGHALEKWLEDKLAEKGVRTFGDLEGKTELQIIASDISRSRLLVLPEDLVQYGIEPKQFSIARVVRMSSSIPFFYEPVKLMHQASKSYSYIVDGAMLSNFPVWIFDRPEPRWPTFGFRLGGGSSETVRAIRNPFSMLRSIFFTMMDAHDNRYIIGNEEIRTIQVPPLHIRLTDFDLSVEDKEKLFQSGVKAGEKFFDNWDYNIYLKVRELKQQVQVQIRAQKK